MFLSLPTRTWVYIATGAAVFFIAAMLWIVQDPVRRRLLVLVPLVGILRFPRLLHLNVTPAEILYYYAAFNVGFPLALAPFRGEYIQRYKDPTFKPSRASQVEQVTLLIIMTIVIFSAPFLFSG